MKHTLVSAISFAALLFFAGCNNDDDPQPETGSANITFNHLVNGNPLAYNVNTYISPGGQQYTISDLKYYISKVALIAENNQPFAQPESYHLIQHHDLASHTINLTHIPAGKYTSLRFSIGVDSVRNHTGAQTGALDPVHGMLWDWTTGYKFFQLEGTSPDSPQPAQTILYHVGRDENYREVTIPLNPEMEVVNNSTHTININADINRLFGTSASPVMINEVHTVMGVTNSTLLANNYAEMFSLESILSLWKSN